MCRSDRGPRDAVLGVCRAISIGVLDGSIRASVKLASSAAIRLAAARDERCGEGGCQGRNPSRHGVLQYVGKGLLLLKVGRHCQA